MTRAALVARRLGAAASAEELPERMKWLLKAWSECRAPELGALIEEASRHLHPPAVHPGQTDAEFTRLMTIGDAISVAAALDIPTWTTAPVLDRLRLLADAAPDPRITSAVLDWLVFVLARRPLPDARLIEVAMVILERSGEPRAALRWAELSAPSAETGWPRGLVGRIGRGFRLDDHRHTLSEDEEALLAVVRARLPRPSRLVPELLELVYADPDADGPRAVLADVLTEARDPRGELIQLQLADVRGVQGLRARIDELVSLYGPRWARMAELDPETVDFERGFPARAALRDSVNAPRWRPELATLRILLCRGSHDADFSAWHGVRELYFENRGISGRLPASLRLFGQLDGLRLPTLPDHIEEVAFTRLTDPSALPPTVRRVRVLADLRRQTASGTLAALPFTVLDVELGAAPTGRPWLRHGWVLTLRRDPEGQGPFRVGEVQWAGHRPDRSFTARECVEYLPSVLARVRVPASQQAIRVALADLRPEIEVVE